MNIDYALEQARQAAAGADEIMMSYYKQDYQTYQKDGARGRAEAVLTEPDLKCDEYLHSFLTKAFPGCSVVTEESVDKLESDWHEREWIWYVDPIDGSLSYLEGSDCFGVSIALCRHGSPVLGVISNPVLELTAWAAEGRGAFLNSEPVSFSPLKTGKPSLMLSVGQNRSPSYRYVMTYLRPDELKLKRSVVTKSILVLSGDADYYFSLPWEVFHGGAPNAWDLAGSAAIFAEAGGLAVDCYGQPLAFTNKTWKWRRGHLFGNPDVENKVLPPLADAIDERQRQLGAK